jgi:hypothetical protein
MQAHNICCFQDLFSETNIIWFRQFFFFQTFVWGILTPKMRMLLESLGMLPFNSQPFLCIYPFGLIFVTSYLTISHKLKFKVVTYGIEIIKNHMKS